MGQERLTCSLLGRNQGAETNQTIMAPADTEDWRLRFSKSLHKSTFNDNITMLKEEGATLFDVPPVLQVGLIATITQQDKVGLK